MSKKEPSRDTWHINEEKRDLCRNVIDHESTNMQKVLQAVAMKEGIERKSSKGTLGIMGLDGA